MSVIQKDMQEGSKSLIHSSSLMMLASSKDTDAISIRTVRSYFLKPRVISCRTSLLLLELTAPQKTESLSVQWTTQISGASLKACFTTLQHRQSSCLVLLKQAPTKLALEVVLSENRIYSFLNLSTLTMFHLEKKVVKRVANLEPAPRTYLMLTRQSFTIS